MVERGASRTGSYVAPPAYRYAKLRSEVLARCRALRASNAPLNFVPAPPLWLCGIFLQAV